MLYPHLDPLLAELTEWLSIIADTTPVAWLPASHLIISMPLFCSDASDHRWGSLLHKSARTPEISVSKEFDPAVFTASASINVKEAMGCHITLERILPHVAGKQLDLILPTSSILTKSLLSNPLPQWFHVQVDNMGVLGELRKGSFKNNGNQNGTETHLAPV
ncbi:hypothetical protein HDU77_010460 [Chytriomyces hyalinus]|nr:hypothetical protein HDU77_010460 [Chytriomyces hyalinus]